METGGHEDPEKYAHAASDIGATISSDAVDSTIAILVHDNVSVTVDLRAGTWTAEIEKGIHVKSEILALVAGRGGGFVQWPLKALSWTKHAVENVDIEGIGSIPSMTVVGIVRTLVISPHHQNNQRFIVTFAIYDRTLLWKVKYNGIDKDGNLDYIKIFDGNWITETPPPVTKPTFVHINGWQSWSYCGSQKCGQDARQPDIALPNYLNAAFHNRERGFLGESERRCFPRGGKAVFEGDMFMPIGFAENDALASSHHKPVSSLILFGFLSQKKQFGTIRCDSVTGGRHKVTMTCGCDGVLLHAGGSIETDWACVMHRRFAESSHWINWHEYIDLVKKICGNSTNGGDRVGWNGVNPLTWCSWYKFGPRIDAKLLAMQADAAKVKDFQLFLIDDGWQPKWGDWVFVKDGEESELCERIKSANMVPGLWMAPFAADFSSELVQRYPYYVLKNSNISKKACNSAYPGKFFAGLDATHPDVLYHVERSIASRAKHFAYLKLDFLYAAVLRDFTGRNHSNNRFDATKTRAEAMEMAMQAMRRGAGKNVFLLGCGCPIGSAIGYMDGMRLGADVGHSWAPKFPLPWWDKTNIPCMRNSIRDVLCRSPMNGRWFIGDPDCILLSSPGLSNDEIVSLASVSAVLGGLVSISDDLLLEKTTARFEVAQKVFPTMQVPFQALDIMTSEIPELFLLRLDDNEEGLSKALLACFNWSSKSGKTFEIDWAHLFHYVPRVVHSLEFWTGDCGHGPLNTVSTTFKSASVPYHGVRMYSLTGILEGSSGRRPIFLGSDIHFGGKEILACEEISPVKISLTVRTFRRMGQESKLFVAVPDQSTLIASGSTLTKCSRRIDKSLYYELVITGPGTITLELNVDS